MWITRYARVGGTAGVCLASLAAVVQVPIAYPQAAGAVPSSCQSVVFNRDEDTATFASDQDLDGDAGSDLVVGVPGTDVDGARDAGAVDVRYDLRTGYELRGWSYQPTPLNPQHLDESFFTPAVAPAAGDEFGAAVAIMCIDDGPGSDLAIGAPGVGGGRGAVTFALGSRAGVTASGALRVDGSTSGEHFGASLAALDHDIWIGAPDRTVDGLAGAGAIEHYRASGGTITHVETITEATPGIPGKLEAGDHFGQVLAVAKRYDGLPYLVVGEPDEDVGRINHAGAITVIRLDGYSATVDGAATYTQNTAGMPGVPEAGDRFGAAVAAHLRSIAVGVPGEDEGTARNAGAVDLIEPAGRIGPVAHARYLRRGTHGLPGRPEPGDRLGSALLIWGCRDSGRLSDSDVLYADPECLAMGAPGADVAGESQAGVVDNIAFDDRAQGGLALAAVTMPVLHQANWRDVGRLGGRPESDEHLGTALAALPFTDINDSDGSGEYDSGGAYLVIAVPGQNLDGTPDAGVAVVTDGDGTHLTIRDSTGPHANEAYGSGARGPATDAYSSESHSP